MPIIRVPYGNALPTEQADYTKQNNLLAAGFMNVNKPIWEDAANNIVQGAIFQVGGTIYHCTAATAIGGVASDYIKLTPSGDGSSLTPTYVANLAGVTWNSAYNGYYDVGGNAYVFDEIEAFLGGQIPSANIKLWQGILKLLTLNNIPLTGTLAYGRKPSSYLQSAGTVTQNQVFDALDPYIPAINDPILLTGGAVIENGTFGVTDYNAYACTFSRAIRTGVNTIDVYYSYSKHTYDSALALKSIVFSAGLQTMTNGSAATAFDRITMAW